jgi:hypothetical protein
MISPHYISGYVDGEGSFLISFSPREKVITGLEVRPSFTVSQRKDRSQVLSLIKAYFNCGTIRYNSSDRTNKYEVRSLRDLLEVIIPHFREFPILSSKKNEFVVFSQICEMMFREEHKAKNGLIKIIDLACKMNNGGTRKYLKQELLDSLKI